MSSPPANARFYRLSDMMPSHETSPEARELEAAMNRAARAFPSATARGDARQATPAAAPTSLPAAVPAAPQSPPQSAPADFDPDKPNWAKPFVVKDVFGRARDASPGRSPTQHTPFAGPGHSLKG